MTSQWITTEIEATVASCFEMLRIELVGTPCVKADYNARLRRLLDNRSKYAVEYKFQNISAVLVDRGQVYIHRNLPVQNYQRALETAVLERLEGRDDSVEVAERSPISNPVPPAGIPRFSDVVAPPPDSRLIARPTPNSAPVKIDSVCRDAVYGLHGEEFIFELEERRLHDEERRPELAPGAMALPR